MSQPKSNEEKRKEFDDMCWRMYGQNFATLCDGGSSGLIWPLVQEALAQKDAEVAEAISKVEEFKCADQAYLEGYARACREFRLALAPKE